MIKLSKRMKAVASMVTPGNILADILTAVNLGMDITRPMIAVNAVPMRTMTVISVRLRIRRKQNEEHQRNN